jgi:hypothetical protein
MDNYAIFLNNVILSNSIQAAFQRSKIYIDKPDKNIKSEFREYIENYLTNLLLHHPWEENDHYKIIEKMSGDFTENFSSILQDSRFRIGVSQKLLNLFLKFHWCAKYIKEPVHCPFDKNIIDQLQLESGIENKWTLMDDIETYKKYVDAAKSIAGNNNLSIAEWELQLWNDDLLSNTSNKRNKRGNYIKVISTNNNQNDKYAMICSNNSNQHQIEFRPTKSWRNSMPEDGTEITIHFGNDYVKCRLTNKKFIYTQRPIETTFRENRWQDIFIKHNLNHLDKFEVRIESNNIDFYLTKL